MSLYKRLALSLTIGFAAIIYLVMWWSGELKENTQLESEQRLHIGLAKHLAQDNPLLAQGVYDYDALKNLFHTLMLLGPSFEFYYLDQTGEIVAHSTDESKIKQQRVSLDPVAALIDGTQLLPVLGDDPRQLDQKKIFSASPVFKDGQLQGFLYIIIRGEHYDSIFETVKSDNQFGLTSLIVGLSLLFLLILLLGLFRYFTLPLCQISNGIKNLDTSQINDKALNLNLSLPQDEELELVVVTINQLLVQLQSQFSQLQDIDEQRRTMLADLSHDLRTPLASLQGYIETLSIQGDNLSAQERMRFIDISMKNAKNLQRLIDQIFELAYLEGGQVTIERESIALGELIYDVAAKFELAATEKEIIIEVIPSKLSYQAIADIGKLERVLSNLIDNAIRHTPKGGHIALEVSEYPTDNNKLQISVRDNGVGIEQHELKHIFQARYRATNSQEDNQKHAGLGLAISHQLVQLFDSELTVKSQINKGTCFQFCLPKNIATS